VGCLLIYRYQQGTKEIREYYTSRAGTFALEALLIACFVYLAVHKHTGLALWGGVVFALLAFGVPLSRRYGPEVKEKRRSDYPMEMLLALGETDGPIHVWFRRPGEEQAMEECGHAFVTFFSPRQPIPERQCANHYRFPVQTGGVFPSIRSILALLEEELSGRDVAVHFGWPTSSWLDRMATGVFVANLLRLPARYPGLKFVIEQPARPTKAADITTTARNTGT
jgi:hypothetical protein